MTSRLEQQGSRSLVAAVAAATVQVAAEASRTAATIVHRASEQELTALQELTVLQELTAPEPMKPEPAPALALAPAPASASAPASVPEPEPEPEPAARR